MSINELQERPSYIKKIEIIGIFNRFDIILVDLQSGLNILYGDNGSGKTTVLHVIANVLNDDYERFIDLEFNHIKITFNNNSFIKILKSGYKDETLEGNEDENYEAEELVWIERSDLGRRNTPVRRKSGREVEIKRLRLSQTNPFPKAAYFPAFRNIIEAWNLLGKTNEQDTLARQLFGNFVPSLNYLSPPQIEEQLLETFKKAKKAVIDYNQEVLSKSFGDILLSFSSVQQNKIESEAQEIFQQIKQLSKAISKHPLQTNINFVAGLEEKIDRAFTSTQENPNLSEYFPLEVLNTYRDALQEIVEFQDEAFSPISNFIELFNASLQRKRLEINRSISATDSIFLKLVYPPGIPFGGIQYLSSGERQIFTLIYALTHISSQNIVLVDEPEISVHINTQTELIKNFFELAPSKQVIFCTHSPTIAGEQIEQLKEIELLATDKGKWIQLQDSEADNNEDEDENLPTYASQDEDFGIYSSSEVLGDKE